jgi:galactokinase
VFRELQQANAYELGADVLVHGEVPMGAGLSSSAAIEVATGFAALRSVSAPVDRKQLALLCQRAENRFVGTQSGIMDQFISCHGKQGHALMLDCRSLEYRLLPIPDSARVVICNTMVKHELSGGEYNQRRAECEQGVKLLSASLPGIRALRDVSVAQFEPLASSLPEVIRRRCRHVISEDERVEQAAEALESGDLTRFGVLMGESHRSLRDDYEVSCRELDIMVELANKLPGVYGARMTGGGFGGCTVNLVEASATEAFVTAIAQSYEQATGVKPEIYVSEAAEGACEVG